MAIKLFVGGLAFSTSNESLRSAFAAVGSVESASVVTDRDTGQSRGFGFVEMATSEDADQAISKLNNTNLEGRNIKVEKANSPGGGRSGGGGGRWAAKKAARSAMSASLSAAAMGAICGSMRRLSR